MWKKLSQFLLVVSAVSLAFSGYVPAAAATYSFSGYLEIIGVTTPDISISESETDSGHEDAKHQHTQLLLQRENQDPIRLELASQTSKTEAELRSLGGQKVKVISTQAVPTYQAGSPYGVLTISDIVLDSPTALKQASVAERSQINYAVVLCRFSDSTSTPKQPVWFDNMFGSTAPGLNHYFKQISYGNANITGKTHGWYNLSQPRSAYLEDYIKFRNDCLAAGDRDINYTNYNGVLVVPNEAYSNFWLGLGTTVPVTMKLDGVDKPYSVTWLQPGGLNQHLFAHEIGHNIGFPHVSDVNGWDEYGSRWDMMSNGYGVWSEYASSYGNIALGTAGHHRVRAGWIPSNKIFAYNRSMGVASIKVASSSKSSDTWRDGENLAIFVPKLTQQYADIRHRNIVIDARSLDSYDSKLPGGLEGLMIHEIDTLAGGSDAAKVVSTSGNTNDAGAIFTLNEVYKNPEEDFGMKVVASSNDVHTVDLFTLSPSITLERFKQFDFAVPANPTLTATASDYDGRVAKVEFYHNGNKIGEDTTAPYSFTWNANLRRGDYQVSAKAIDNEGRTQDSNILVVRVRNPIETTQWTPWVADGSTPSEITMTKFGNRLYQAVRGNDSTIWTRSTADGQTWTGWVGNGATPEVITMAEFNNRLYQAVRGTDGNIYTRFTTDGNNWSVWVPNGATPGRISMQVFGNKLVQAVRGTDSVIYTRFTTDGNNWSAWISNGQTPGNITMAVHDNKLYQAVRGTDNVIYTRFSTDAQNWSFWRGEGSTTAAITMVSYKTRLYQAVRGTDNITYVRYSQDGITWSPWVADDSGISNGDATMVVHDGKLFQTGRTRLDEIKLRSYDGNANDVWTEWITSGFSPTNTTMASFNGKLYLTVREANGTIWTTRTI